MLLCNVSPVGWCDVDMVWCMWRARVNRLCHGGRQVYAVGVCGTRVGCDVCECCVMGWGQGDGGGVFPLRCVGTWWRWRR